MKTRARRATLAGKMAWASLMALAASGAPWGAPMGLALDSLDKTVLRPNGITWKDLEVFPPTAREDSLRLTRVEALLREPVRVEAVLAEILARTGPDSQAVSPPLAPDSLWALLDVPAPGAISSRGVTAGATQVPGLLKAISGGLQEHASALTGAEKAFLYREASSLFLQDVEDTSLDAVTAELKRMEEDARVHGIMGVAAKLRWPGLTRAAAAAARLQAWILESLRANGEGPTLAALRRATGGMGGKGFRLHVGGKGSDRHVADEGLWIDLGGDDEYELRGPSRPGAFLLIVDLGGRDLYRGRDSLNTSAGNMGISMLADLGGDDHYLGENFAFGSALFGYAHLYDASGDDVYEGRCASLGFAFFGIGILQDEDGHDSYSASLLSEGASSTKGLGMLLDRAGDDRYLARPTFLDDLRYVDHHLHLMQGFSTGMAPDFPGGIGVLRDRRGNDVYLADIFGQGSAYWYALGILADGSGNDRYEAHQYAQGAGIHIAVGVLADASGDDRYASKGVSQGCGHDYGFGLLFDRAGDDAYQATDMSQGAGSANGLGILQDAAGDDAYRSKNPDMTLGHADMRRDRGSFGFFLDMAGKDAYAGSKADGAAWRAFNGKTKGNGYGLDR